MTIFPQGKMSPIFIYVLPKDKIPNLSSGNKNRDLNA